MDSTRHAHYCFEGVHLWYCHNAPASCRISATERCWSCYRLDFEGQSVVDSTTVEIRGLPRRMIDERRLEKDRPFWFRQAGS